MSVCEEVVQKVEGVQHFSMSELLRARVSLDEEEEDEAASEIREALASGNLVSDVSLFDCIFIFIFCTYVLNSFSIMTVLIMLYSVILTTLS